MQYAKCTSGDDALCIVKDSATPMCCATVKLEEKSKTPTAAQTAQNNQNMKDMKWMPQEVGVEGSYCEIMTTMEGYRKLMRENENGFRTDESTGYMYTGMCSGAIAQASATAGALVAAVIASTY